MNNPNHLECPCVCNLRKAKKVLTEGKVEPSFCSSPRRRLVDEDGATDGGTGAVGKEMRGVDVCPEDPGTKDTHLDWQGIWGCWGDTLL